MNAKTKYDFGNLNPNQRRAVEITDGPLLIIAGPGSGKTHTLVERIVYLILEKNVKPENILIATFTEKAAQELVTRVSNKLNDLGITININEMYIGTIHSICLRILKENIEFTRLKKNYRLLDQFEQQYFIYQNIKRYQKINNYEIIFNGELPSAWRQSEILLNWINKISEELFNPEKLVEHESLAINAIGEVYQLYSEFLEMENILDFSTIQLEAYKLLKDNTDVLSKLHEQIQYLMIDEYQDTNTVQERIMFLLAGTRQNICVVGDDDQGLYRFRGATIRNILEFPDNFKKGECKQVRLDINYRSQPDIISFYNEWMSELKWDGFRYDKTIKPSDKEFIDSKTVIKLYGEDHEEDWHENVYNFIIKLKNSGRVKDLNQIAFLFRSVKNEKVVGLANYLEENGIPVYSPRSDMFFDREEIRYMIGAIIALFPKYQQIRQWDDDVTLDVWDYYDECFKMYYEYIKTDEEMFSWTKKMAKDHTMLNENTDYAFSGLFYQLLRFPLFNRFLDDNCLNGIMDSRPTRNLGIFSQLLTKFEYLHNVSVLTPKNINKNITDLFNIYMKFLIDGGIGEYEDNSEYAPSGCVSFLTIHQSKGMEFPIVFVGSLENVPRKQYTEIDEILQNEFYSKPPFEPIERTKEFDFWRLYYTGFSRAQDLLILTCIETVHREKRHKKVPSKYFENLYRKLTDWRSPEFKLDRFEFKEVREVNLKNTYSFTSHIALFENCALQYKFYKELEFSPVRVSATIFGTLVHQTIEDVHKAVLRGEEDIINDKQIEKWFDMNYNGIVKKEKVYLPEHTRKTALNQVLLYVDKHEDKWDRIKEAEVEVSLVKPEYILQGTIDLIRGDNDTVEIVDFKSEKKPDMEKDKDKIERYRKQLEVYAHLIEEKTCQKVSRLNLYYTGEKDGNPYISFKKDSLSIDKTIKVFDNVVKKIENKEFMIKEKSTKLCGECDMRFYCGYKK